MTSARQQEANRRNALKSTGPRTLSGKLVSRRNALRHGLTAETLIEPLEDPKVYRAFEAAIVAEYVPRSFAWQRGFAGVDGRTGRATYAWMPTSSGSWK